MTNEEHEGRFEEFLLIQTQVLNQQTQVLIEHLASFDEVRRSLDAIASRLEDLSVAGVPGVGAERPTPVIMDSIGAYQQTVGALTRLPWDLEASVEARRAEVEAPPVIIEAVIIQTDEPYGDEGQS